MVTASGIYTPSSRRLPGRRYDHAFFLSMVVALVAIVFVGFSSTFYLAGLYHAHLASPILYVHGTLNSLWMILLLVEALLASSKKLALHRTLGTAGMALVALMFITGVLVTADQARRHAFLGWAGMSEEIFAMIEICNFGVLAGAAFLVRRHPAAHKRLILLATIAMMPGAFARFPVELLQTNTLVLAFCVGLLLIPMWIYDLWSTHRIHPTTGAVGIWLFAYPFFAIHIGNLKAWHIVIGWMQSWGI